MQFFKKTTRLLVARLQYGRHFVDDFLSRGFPHTSPTAGSSGLALGLRLETPVHAQEAFQLLQALVNRLSLLFQSVTFGQSSLKNWVHRGISEDGRHDTGLSRRMQWEEIADSRSNILLIGFTYNLVYRSTEKRVYMRSKGTHNNARNRMRYIRVFLSSLAISSSVHQPLATDPGERIDGSLRVVDFKGGAVVVPEVELRQIPVKMLASAVLVDAIHAAFEH